MPNKQSWQEMFLAQEAEEPDTEHKLTLEVLLMNSALIWWPVLRRLADQALINVPETIMISADIDPMTICRGEGGLVWQQIVEQCRVACNEIGLPVFLRTDFGSHKHWWNKSCYLTNSNNVESHLLEILEPMAMSFITIPCQAIMVREFLELNWKFRAFVGQMPIAREFRFFVRDGNPVHVQPYWPEDSITRPDTANWQELLIEMSILRPEECQTLFTQAQIVGQHFSGYWSIDFCQSKDGRWFVTDMALGEHSYRYRPPQPCCSF